MKELFRSVLPAIPVKWIAGGALTAAFAIGLIVVVAHLQSARARHPAVNPTLRAVALPAALTTASLPTPWSSDDIGSVGAVGSSSAANGVFRVNGSGADIWGTADAFQFDYQSVSGDVTITARVVSQTDTNQWAKAGVMIRETLTPGSREAMAAVTPARGLVFQRRTATAGQSTSSTGPLATASYWVRLVRVGATVTAYASINGATWTQMGQDTVSMASTLFVGLAVTSHDAGVLSTVSFDNVTVTTLSVMSHTDIGAVGAAGSSSVANGVFNVKGSGADIWGTADAFQFDYQVMSGDTTVTARVVSQTNTNQWAKAGVMIRETLTPGSSEAMAAVTPARGIVFQRRTVTGAQSTSTPGPVATAPYWVRLVRSGATITAFASADGTSWNQVGRDTLPMASTVYVGLAVTSHAAGVLSTATFDHVTLGPSALCNPLKFGALADGATDDTTAIQNAVDACSAQGGGTVELPPGGSKSVYLTGPIHLKSHVHLQIDAGVILQATNDHSRYAGAYINWVYQPTEALISAAGATDVAVVGAGTIDGAGGQLQPDGGPSWWTLRSPQRPYVLEFYQCNQVTISGVTLQNAPFWNQALRFSQNITESGLTILAPVSAPNTDGVDIVGSSNVTLSDLNIAVGDDDIAIKSGLPLDPSDPKQTGIPRMATSQVLVSNITATGGRGIAIGSEMVNGINNVTIQNVHLSNTSGGFRIKGARDRDGHIYAITLKDVVMVGVGRPINIADYYPNIDAPVEPPFEAAAPITATTPFIHDILIQNLMATNSFGQSLVEGLPESCIHNLTLNGVSIQSANQPANLGMVLRHATGTFTNVASVPGTPNPAFVVQENVAIASAGSTPPIAATPPHSGQIACNAQVMPPP